MSRGWSRLLRYAVTAIIVVMLVLFARTVDWTQTWAAIRTAAPDVLIAAAVVNLLSLAVKGIRWWLFLRPVGATSLWLAMRATFAGAGLNNVLVANSGEAARVIFVARSAHVSSARVLATLALERLFELVGYVVMLVGSLSFLALPPEVARTRPFAIAALVVLLALMVYLVRRPPIAAAVDHDQGSLWGRVRTYFSHFVHAISGLSTTSRFVAALGLSVLAWALQVATYHLTARAAHFDISVVGTVAALIAVNLGFAIRATPGNLGVFQLLYALSAEAFGLDKDRAIAVALLIQTQQILPVTLIGVGLAPQFIFRRRAMARSPEDALPGETIVGDAHS